MKVTMHDRAAVVPATPKTDCALRVARDYPDELPHLEQVARLAVLLFRSLGQVHKLGPHECELLCCAALLHDVGISVSYPGHHKKSLKLILRAELPALTAREREIVANVARYHRKAKPSAKHQAFARLPAEDQQLVCKLAAILRLADGLDRAHENAVSAVEASADPQGWAVAIAGPGNLAYAAASARRKADLFEDVYDVKIRFEPG